MVSLGDTHLRIAEEEGPEALRAAIVALLRSGTLNPVSLGYLADLFDPTSNAKFKVEITYRKEGSERQRRQREQTLLRLTKIFREMKNTQNFINHAATVTGLDPKSVRRYKNDVIALANALDQHDSECFELNTEDRKSKSDSI